MSVLTLNAITGGLLVVSGILVLARQMLLEPDSARYPKAPQWLLTVMLIVAGSLLFVGLQTIVASEPVQGKMALMAVVLFLYKASMLANLVRQRYPEDTWRRLNRIHESLTCGTAIPRWLSK